MSNLIKKNYKTVLIFCLFLGLMPLIPTMIEIIFKFGNIVGTYIRMFGTYGICI